VVRTINRHPSCQAPVRSRAGGCPASSARTRVTVNSPSAAPRRRPRLPPPQQPGHVSVRTASDGPAGVCWVNRTATSKVVSIMLLDGEVAVHPGESVHAANSNANASQTATGRRTRQRVVAAAWGICRLAHLRGRRGPMPLWAGSAALATTA
jgi:hypothetical protein